jgi:hypothetical protein
MAWPSHASGSLPRPAFALLLATLALSPACGRAGEPSGPDPLAAEIERCAECRGAREALRDGRRLLALKRLAAERVEPSAAAYAKGLPADRKTPAGFEAEWARAGDDLRSDLVPPSPAAFDGVRPAAARALAEAALPQVKVYHQAGLEYGRNTTPEKGLFYLGAARAQSELADFFRALDEPSTGSPPPLRPLDPELDALESELLAAYRPPASLANHADFIATSAILKEARELNEAGLLHGALLRILEAAQGLAALGSGPPPGPETLAGRISAFEMRLSQSEVDHSIGRMFLETAQAHASSEPGMSPAVAQAIVDDVLPLYFATLGPAPLAKPEPAPSVTVTLVRWPFT